MIHTLNADLLKQQYLQALRLLAYYFYSSARW